MDAACSPSCLSPEAGAPPPEQPDGNYFVSAYPPFSVWTQDQVPRVHRVLEAPPSRAETPLGLYIHVPFCARRCTYCYYLSQSDRSWRDMEDYVEALLWEAERLRRAPAMAGRNVTFAYFGGGTPSFLPTELLRRLFDGLRGTFPMHDVREVTFECAPQTCTEDKLRLARDAGVTRLSLGVQSFDDDVLRRSGRIHRCADVERALAAIGRVEFNVVNVDLMVGLPGQPDETCAADIERIARLRPQSVTIYPLEMPPYTPLHKAWKSGALSDVLADWEAKRTRLDLAFARLEQSGYSVRSAYAAVLDPVRHAFVYQDAQYHGADLVGMGAASFSYVGGVHFQNLASLADYQGAVGDGRLPIARAYALGSHEQARREMVLQLKLGRLEWDYFRAKFGIDPAGDLGDAFERFVHAGLATCDACGLRLTRAGLWRADRLARELFLPEHRVERYN